MITALFEIESSTTEAIGLRGIVESSMVAADESSVSVLSIGLLASEAREELMRA
jgi:hypothetical protein